MADKPDFTGYATKVGIRCTDGRTIKAHAFRNNDGQSVPLVWQHQHNSPDNVLGHVVLHNIDDGVRAEGFFNDTPTGLQAKALVHHKDIKWLSIYATQLVQQGLDVVHGMIREVSLVLSGANPGAMIDNVSIAHGDGSMLLEDEAIIYTNEEIQFSEDAATPVSPEPVLQPKPSLALAAGSLSHAVDTTALTDQGSGSGAPPPLTVQDVLDSLTEEQSRVVFGLIGAAISQSSDSASSDGTSSTIVQDDKEGDQVSRNVFDQTGGDGNAPAGTTTLSHSDLRTIFADANKRGSLKDAVEDYALSHGIDNIDLMFPDARAVSDTPEWVSRRQEWVQSVLSGTRHTPFSRIKSLLADITLDEARARGYVKGAVKREEFINIAKRVTTPQTVYKKQKLDRDDILDITDFDVVVWLKAEMRVMLDEEVARAVLMGDGRDVADPDKINEINVRPILTDADLYVTTVNVDLSGTSTTAEAIVDGIVTAMQYYMGTGVPTFYGPRSWITKMLLAKDEVGRRLHQTVTELASAMGVQNIVAVDVMETIASTTIGIIVNLQDYTIGADRGGEVNFFDDFDIDYNQYKYLYETRLSGALTKFKSALVIKSFTGAGGLLPAPTPPSFVKSTGVITVPDIAHQEYYVIDPDGRPAAQPMVAGAQPPLDPGMTVHIRAVADATYAFPDTGNTDWTFQMPRANGPAGPS